MNIWTLIPYFVLFTQIIIDLKNHKLFSKQKKADVIFVISFFFFYSALMLTGTINVENLMIAFLGKIPGEAIYTLSLLLGYKITKHLVEKKYKAVLSNDKLTTFLHYFTYLSGSFFFLLLVLFILMYLNI